MPKRNSSKASPAGARELRFPGWYVGDGKHVHGHYHRTCLERHGLAYVLEEYPDRVKRGRAPCPLCVPRQAPISPPAARVTALGEGRKLPGQYNTGTGVLWGAYHTSCLRRAERAGGTFQVSRAPNPDDQDERPCPLCTSR